MIPTAAVNDDVPDDSGHEQSSGAPSSGGQPRAGQPRVGEVREIESRLCMSLLVRQCAVVGEYEEYYAALLVPDKYSLGQYLQSHNPAQEFRLDGHHRLNHIDIRVVFCDLIESINKSLDGKRIERFALVDGGRKTTRESLCAENRVVIDSLFQDYIPGIG